MHLQHLLLSIMGSEYINRLALTIAMDPISPWWDDIMGLLSLRPFEGGNGDWDPINLTHTQTTLKPQPI